MRKRSKFDDGFVGRNRELAILAKLARGVAAKHGGTVLASGEAGIGMTALLNAAFESAGLVVLRASASPLGVRPFGPIVTLLQSLRGHASGPVAERANAALRLLAAAPGDSGNSASAPRWQRHLKTLKNVCIHLAIQKARRHLRPVLDRAHRL